MVKRRVFDDEKHVHFVTFSCCKRRAFLQQDLAKRIVIDQLRSDCLEVQAKLSVWIHHVQALVWFREPRQRSPFMNKWKHQWSHEIKKLYRAKFPKYWEQIDDADPIWQPRYYGFNI